MVLEEVAVGGIVRLPEERLLPPVATLSDMVGDMVGNAGEDETGKPGHEARLARMRPIVDLVHCHLNPLSP